MADDAENNDISNANGTEAEDTSTPDDEQNKSTPVETFEKKKVRKLRAKRIAIPKDSASFFRARAKQFHSFKFTSDGNLQVPELAGEAAKVIELPLYRQSTEEELEETASVRRQELENVEREYDEMLSAFKDAMNVWRETGASSDVIAAQRELQRLDSLRSQLRSPLRWTKEFKGLSIRQLMPDLFYEVRKVGYKCYGMRLRNNQWDEMTKIGELPTPLIEEGAGEETDDEEEETEGFVFFNSPNDPMHPEHCALSPDTMIEFVYNSTKYNSLIQAYEVERLTHLGRRKDLGPLFLRSRNPAQIRALASRLTGDVENPRELWINILKTLLAQHPQYTEILRSTGKDTLVYANPKDTRWGIGLSADDSGATERSEWKGTNLLGQAWQVVRDGLDVEGETETAQEVQGIQEGGVKELYTDHGRTREESHKMTKNILKGYYKMRGKGF